MKSKVLCLVMITLAGFSVFSKAEAMTAERVIENMMASYERQMKDIDDLIIIMEVTCPFPQTSIIYQKRAVVEGRIVYKTRNEIEMMGKKSITIYDGMYFWQVDPVSGKLEKEKMDISPYAMLENLKAAEVKYAGIDSIDGHKTHILKVKDLKMMDVEGMQEVSGKVWVDAKDWIIRKMKMDMEMEDEKGEKKAVKVTVRFEDIRKVKGMLIAYRTVMNMPVPGAPEISPEEEQEMRKNLAEMQKGLEEMPPAQRKMIEAMMKPKIEMMEKMLAGAGIETVTVVKDVKVNTGLSDDLFDGSKLR